MLTTAVDSPTLPAGWAAEPKWDSFRAQLAVRPGERVLLRSRQDTDMTAAFPEIRAAALAQLPPDTGLDGELVVWEHGRLAFDRLQPRLARRGRGAAEGAGRWPAHYVVSDLVHADGTDLTGWPYERRRAALEALFRPPAGGAADAVPVDHRSGCDARLAGVDGRQAGGPVLQTAGRALHRRCSGVAEVQGAHRHRGPHRCRHRHPSGAQDGAAGPLRHRGAAAVRRPRPRVSGGPWATSRSGRRACIRGRGGRSRRAGDHSARWRWSRACL
nr:hypothetical protein [Streptomyces lasalocidi]